ncbi:hypothetical protein PISMIDRAFT_15810 [Pisolithus microcarpus 441]|uniref:Uncharacterized protein n=1 Tax=Pisolithus microcarpus 441 TaxID=765257 RepID=A0A0C9Z9E7_9AGAM|nr:hypothetical protein BKA83DRAFT_15810 [Pisolithus microcarpus]KIK16498.1 hypothetical protein PISMIDRAFT_15810 [Pisolithus microcarpus 441]
MTITPGLYRITTRLRPDALIGVDPYIRSAIKPVVIAVPEFSPDGTTWRVLEEDGQLYLLLVHTANTRSESLLDSAPVGTPTRTPETGTQKSLSKDC